MKSRSRATNTLTDTPCLTRKRTLELFGPGQRRRGSDRAARHAEDRDAVVVARKPRRITRTDAERGLEERRGEPFEEVAVDLALDPDAAERIGGGRAERDRRAVGAHQPRPDHQSAVLPGLEVGLIFADQPAAARDQHLLPVEPAHVARHQRARRAGASRIERGFEHGGDQRALRYGRRAVAHHGRAGSRARQSGHGPAAARRLPADRRPDCPRRRSRRSAPCRRRRFPPRWYRPPAPAHSRRAAAVAAARRPAAVAAAGYRRCAGAVAVRAEAAAHDHRLDLWRGFGRGRNVERRGRRRHARRRRAAGWSRAPTAGGGARRGSGTAPARSRRHPRRSSSWRRRSRCARDDRPRALLDRPARIAVRRPPSVADLRHARRRLRSGCRGGRPSGWRCCRARSGRRASRRRRAFPCRRGRS